MYSFRSRRKKTLLQRYGSAIALTAIGGASVSFGFLMPAVSGTGAQSRVFSEGLKIELDRTSPAFAALEDAWVADDAVASATPRPAQSVELLAGVASSAPMADRIARDNIREQVLYRHEYASREANSQAMAKAAADILRNMTSHFEAPAESVPAQTAPTQVAVNAAAPAASPRHEVHNISLTDLHMSREELLGSLFLPIAQYGGGHNRGGALPMRGLANANGGYSNVAGLGRSRAREVDERLAKTLRVISARHPETTFAVQGKASAFSAESAMTKYSQFLPPGAAKTAEKAAAALAESTTLQPLHQIVVAGSLEFTDGLALSNSMDRVVVFRDVDGETQEAGAVWLREGRYEIFVEETVGSLVGELRTPYGDVVGRGSLDLTQVQAAGSQHKVTGVALKLHPVEQGMGGHVISQRADGKQPNLRGAAVNFVDLAVIETTEKGGRFNAPNLVEGSISIAKITHPHYWGSIAFSHAGTDNKFDLIPDQQDQLVNQVVEHLRESSPYQTQKAIVWGRVLENGRPVANMQVQLADAGDVPHPIYFDESMRPDPSARMTSSNGYYAFYPITPGTQSARVLSEDGATTEPELFLAAGGMVSHIDLETKSSQTFKVRVFDAFKTDTPLSALISPPGDAHVTAIDGSGPTALRVLKGTTPLMIDAEVGAIYTRVRVTSDRSAHSLYIPMIEKVWLERIQGASQFNPAPDAGTVVGFVAGKSPFKVIAGSAKVIYFTAAGEISTADFGDAGGGYVILNAAQGFQTITVQDSGSTKMSSVVTVVDPSLVNVLNHKL